MSRIAHVSVNKNSGLFKTLKDKSINFFSEILPKDIELNKEIIIENGLSFTAILNPTNAVSVSEKDALIGLIYEDINNVWKNFGYIPDGNYIIKRENNEVIEFVTDYQATKSLWYYKDETIFICSSSQRFIVHLLGEFKLNRQAVMWMLSSGCIGYKHSWDKRIKSIPPASILNFQKNTWDYQISAEPIIFKSNNLSLKRNVKQLDVTIGDIFDNVNLNKIKSIQAITGGFDSRTVFLYLIKNNPHLHLMTFGQKESINIKYSDLFVSKMFSEKYNLKWSLFDTNLKIENLDNFFDNVLKLGEGRIDLLDRLIDNFRWMKDLFDNKYDIVFNGMDGISQHHPWTNQRLIFEDRKLTLLKDYSNIDKSLLNIANQEIDESLFKKTNESWAENYNRIFQSYWIPYADSALNEIQNIYFESMNPLISKSVVKFIRKIPDSQRIFKKIGKQLVYKIDNSNIPFANQVSVFQTSDLVKQRCFSNYFDECITSISSNLFPKESINNIIKNTSKTNLDTAFLNRLSKSSEVKNIVSNKFPTLVHKYIENKHKRMLKTIDPFMLKYRMFIVLKMIEVFKNDIKF